MSIKNTLLRLIDEWSNFFISNPGKDIPRPDSLLSGVSDLPNLPKFKETLERILTENIIPFWYPQVMDMAEGGYRLNHDLRGRWKGRANKRLVTQARTLWFFSRLAETEYGTAEHLEAARHGYEFLVERLWDEEFGGFYWEVDSGGVVTKPDKQLYGQAFALFALSQYALVSGDPKAATLARELFALLENRAHDQRYGGYREFFHRDWELAPEESRSYIHASANVKLMNTHLHLLEALTMYFLLTGDRVARERLIDLVFIQSNAVVRKTIGACTNEYRQNWIPLNGPAHDRVSYGHDLENLWLLTESCNAAGISSGPLLDLCQTLFQYSLRYGFDREQGGFYHTGPINAPADRREKIWWVQAEGLVGALKMYELTRDDVYIACFSRTLDWIVRHQTDWQHGDWHAQVSEKGRPSGDKAGEWKCPYHNGRAMIECLGLLRPFS